MARELFRSADRTHLPDRMGRSLDVSLDYDPAECT